MENASSVCCRKGCVVMAELIDKGAVLVDMNALLEELEDYIEYDTFDHYKEEPLINMSFETLEDVITSQPTTTEAEIRNKAIDEFAEWIKSEFKTEIQCSDEELTWIDEAAEQLNGE